MCAASWEEEVGRLTACPPCRCGALFRGRPACSSRGGRGPHPTGPHSAATKIINNMQLIAREPEPCLTDERMGEEL
jgi:hypothetical protein